MVKDGYFAGVIIHGVIYAFGEPNAASRDHNRTLRHVVCTKRDDVGTGSAELSSKNKLVFLGNLFGNGLGRVVQLVVSVAASNGIWHALVPKIVVQVLAERLCLGQEHASVAYGIALNEVEIAVGMHLIVVVKSVCAHHPNQGLVFYLRFGNVSKVNACGVALVLDF